MDQVKELEELAATIRAKKGRSDTAARDRASTLLRLIWANPEIDPCVTFAFLEDIPSEALADGIGSVWQSLAPKRKEDFHNWVPRASTDKAARRLALLAASVVATDGQSALQWLARLVPENRRQVSKDLRQMLTPILFGDKQVNFDNLGHADSPAPVVLRLYSALLDIVSTGGSTVSPVTKSRLALSILRYLSSLSNDSDPVVSELRARISAISKTWPKQLQEQFDQHKNSLNTSSPAVPRQPEPVSNAEPVPSMADSDKHIAATITADAADVIRSGLDARIASIEREVEFFRDVRTLLDHLTASCHDLAEKSAETEDRLTGLRTEYAELRSKYEDCLKAALVLKNDSRVLAEDRDRQRVELGHERQRCAELTARLDSLQADYEAERKRLAQQISANAAGRIEEFKNRLGISLSPLVVDLPSRNTIVTPDLGRVLLLQFHQFLDALSQEGVSTRPRKAS